MSAADWATAVKADAKVATYSMGMMMTVRIRLIRADGDGSEGSYDTDEPLSLCVKLALGDTLPNGKTAQATPTALCFYNGSAGVLADDPIKDSKVSGFTAPSTDTWQSVALVKPAKLAKGTVIGTKTGPNATANEIIDLTSSANAATYKAWKVDMAGPSNVKKAEKCIGAFMGTGSCLLGFSIYLPIAAGTAT